MVHKYHLKERKIPRNSVATVLLWEESFPNGSFPSPTPDRSLLGPPPAGSKGHLFKQTSSSKEAGGGMQWHDRMVLTAVCGGALAHTGMA